MCDFPPDVTREILLRLPAECVFRLRSLCKAWRRMIDDPSFIRAHLQNQAYSNSLLLRKKFKGAPLYSLSLDSINFINGPQITEATRCNQIDATLCDRIDESCCRGVESGDVRYPVELASCNGLILHWRDPIWAIWNPLTGDHRDLPLPGVRSGEVYGVGFGYDVDGDDYKVVRIENDVHRTLVYSLKYESWRQIGDCPGRVQSKDSGAFLNNTLYWLSHNEYEIVALHLGTETYTKIPLPSSDVARSNFPFRSDLSAGDGVLIFGVRIFHLMRFDGWVMEDEGLWVRLFSFDMHGFGRAFRDRQLRVVAYLKSKRTVILQHDFCFICVDVDTSSFKKFSIHGFHRIKSYQFSAFNLVRLNVGGPSSAVEATATKKTSTRKRKRDINKRLKLCVRDAGEQCCSENRYCSKRVCRLCKLDD